jgi:hypothetical protein
VAGPPPAASKTKVFPRCFYAATVRLGILDRLKYVGREYVEDGTEYYEVIVHIGASDRFLEMGPWCVIATVTRLPAKP